jgi:hypothetical protein
MGNSGTIGAAVRNSRTSGPTGVSKGIDHRSNTTLRSRLLGAANRNPLKNLLARPPLCGA